MLKPALRILLIEDSRSEALYIQRTLTQVDPTACRITVVQTIARALEALDGETFDVVLMDLQLPDVIGLSGLQALQGKAPRLPVVILTGYDDRVMENAAVEQGAQDYLLKDRATASALNRAMQHAIQRKQIETLKAEFVSLVSHELRTPLTAIHGALGLINGVMLDQVPPQVARLIEIANRNTERLLCLISDILDTERLEGGQMTFDPRNGELDDIVAQSVEACRALGDASGVKLRYTVPDAPLMIRADTGRLTQVVTNFLSNAIKFSYPGGEVEVWTSQRGGWARVHVRDHGAGVPDHFREHIFTKFSQADAAMVRRNGGAGLGLYVSKQIMEHMSGHIGFESVPGKGATFWAELPVLESLTVQKTESLSEAGAERRAS